MTDNKDTDKYTTGEECIVEKSKDKLNVQNENNFEIAKSEQQVNDNTKSRNNVGFWLGVISAVLVVLQVVFSFLNINFDAKMLIEISSFAVAILVVFGVLKSNSKSKNLSQIQSEIKNQLTTKVDEIYMNKTLKNKTQKQKDEDKTN